MRDARHEYQVSRLEDVSTPELVSGAARAARRLVQAEIALAKEELQEQQRGALVAAIWGAVAFAAIILSLAASLVALSLANSSQILLPSVCAIASALLSVFAASVAYRSWPRSVMPRTRERLEHEVTMLRKHAT